MPVTGPVSDALFSTILARLERLSGPDASGNYTARCPWHEDKHPSLSLHPQRGWKCHAGCGQGAIADVAHRLGLDEASPRMSRTAQGGKRSKLSQTAAMEAMRARGFGQETIDYFQIEADVQKQAWRYPIPDFNGHVAAVRFKSFPGEGRPKNWWPKKEEDTHRFPIYADWSRIESDAVLTAGEPDFWTAWQMDLPAMTLLHGEGNLDAQGRALEILKALHILKGLHEVTIIPDNDLKGQEAVAKWKAALKRTGLTVHILHLPDVVSGQPVKDLNDALVALGGDTKALKKLLAAQMDGGALERDETEASDHWAVETASTIRQRNDPVPPWLAEGIMRQGELSVLSGRFDSLKSTFALELAVAVASSQPFLGRFPIEASGPVFIVQEEVHPAFYSRRIRRATEGLPQEVTDRILVWSRKGLMLDPKSDGFQRFQAIVEEHRPILVILDNLSCLYPPGFRENDAAAMSELVRPLKAVIDLCESGILAVHHDRKPFERDSGHSPRGSSVLENAPDTRIHIIRDAENPAWAKIDLRLRNGGAVAPFHVELVDGRLEASEREVTVLTSTERANTIRALKELGGSGTADQVAANLCLNREAVRKRLDRMVADGLAEAEKNTRPYMYKLTEQSGRTDMD